MSPATTLDSKAAEAVAETTGNLLTNFVHENLINLNKKYPLPITIAVVGLAALGIRNMILAHSITSVAMGAFFTVPAYVLFTRITNVADLKQALQETDIYITLKQEISGCLSQYPILSTFLVGFTVLSRIKVMSFSDMMKTVAVFSVAGLAFSKMDKTAALEKAKDLWTDLVSKIGEAVNKPPSEEQVIESRGPSTGSLSDDLD